MIDVVIARLKHVQWMYQLELALQKRSIILDLSTYDECELGRWLYSDALKTYADIPEVALLEESHKKFHLAANKVVKWHNAPSISSRLDAQAQIDFEEAHKMSKEVIYLISMLEFKLLKSFTEINEPKGFINVINNPLKALGNLFKK
ncbi:MAG: CZB domain-containing protein [Candidatus Magnetominusculus sp. LBB02]|nr:CZB domain-containing protein [Candidatus Magnetominusculus sp. LBB02]